MFLQTSSSLSNQATSLMQLPKGAKSELAFASSLFAVGLIVFIDTWRSVLPAFNLTVSPKLFPYAISTYLMVQSLVLMVRIVMGDVAEPESMDGLEGSDKTDFKTFGLVLGSLLAFVLLIERAGFIIAASVTFFGITVAFDNKKPGRAALFGTIFVTVIYLAFTKFLNVQLPAGILKGIL